jgi:mitochondrial import inner membrane translocase subunit TIM50
MMRYGKRTQVIHRRRRCEHWSQIPIHFSRCKRELTNLTNQQNNLKSSSENAGIEGEQKEIPLSELPDLTQGIPSTWEYEAMAGKNKDVIADIATQEASSGGRGRKELPASAYISSSERRRQRFANWMYLSMLGGTVTGLIYLGRNWEEHEITSHTQAPNGWGIGLWWDRAMTRIREVMSYYQEPAFEKLLPDPDPSFERPYTLVISLEDMLVHSEWTREHGWRVAKRPGADYFLRYLSQYYELVLFTSVPFAIGEPLLRKLDPFHIIMWPLFREATKFQDGEVVKVSCPKYHCMG